MQVEGLENAEVTDSGVDDSGNTYQAGVVSTDNGTYNWRVSVIELDEVYDISGLPNTAFYVGIRFTAQAQERRPGRPRRLPESRRPQNRTAAFLR